MTGNIFESDDDVSHLSLFADLFSIGDYTRTGPIKILY